MKKNIVYGILEDYNYSEIRDKLVKTEPENLRTFYSVLSEWTRHYNNMSWGVGAVLVPLSFSGFALSYPTDKYLVYFVGLPSIMLLIFWQLIIYWQRKLWKRCLAITSIIEEIWGIRKTSNETSVIPFIKIFRIDYGALLRLFLVLGGSFFWVWRINYELKIF